MQNAHTEWIKDGEKTVAVILRADFAPTATTFITPPDSPQQIGLIVYPADSRIQAHEHLPIERHLVGTSEVILVRSGHAFVDIYSSERKLITSREMFPGDLVMFHGCGHGFRICENTVLMEIKQGPYFGIDEKECFHP